MPRLTDEQVERLHKDRDAVQARLAQLDGYAEQFQLANPYAEFRALLTRQTEALTDLLEERECRHAIDTLAFDAATMTSGQHLANLKAIAEATRARGEDETGDYYKDRAKALHKIRDLPHAAMLAYRSLSKILPPAREKAREQPAESAKWTL